MDREESKWEWVQTKSMFLRYLYISLGVPSFAFLVFWLYITLAGEIVRYGEWKTVVLILWLGTLAVLAWSTISSVGEQRSLLRPWRETTSSASARKSSSWELKNTKRLALAMCLAVVLVPFFCLSLVYLASLALGTSLSSEDLRTAAVIIWAGTLFVLFRISRRAAKAQVLLTKTVYQRR